MPKLPIIWVIGGPGSGKGTLCQLLSSNHNFYHLSAGGLLRDEVKSGSSLASDIEEYMRNGKIVSSDITLHLMEKAMHTNKRHNGFLIDGFPRETQQGLEFEERIAPTDCILFLEASEATSKKRLQNRSKSSTRVDDNEESIRKRLEVHRKLEADILKTFKSKVRKICAEGSIQEVYEQAVAMLGDFLDEGQFSCD